jgi:hypothetical protein
MGQQVAPARFLQKENEEARLSEAGLLLVQ